jgi:hypothetical protein
MKKRNIVEQTLGSAELAITTINSGKIPEIYSLDKWTEALLKYVLNDNQGSYNPYPIERTHAQYIENLQFKFDDIEKTKKLDGAIGVLNEFIAAVHDATDYRIDLGDEIVYQPIFDRE